jgi:hypothetical protein
MQHGFPSHLNAFQHEFVLVQFPTAVVPLGMEIAEYDGGSLVAVIGLDETDSIEIDLFRATVYPSDFQGKDSSFRIHLEFPLGYPEVPIRKFKLLIDTSMRDECRIAYQLGAVKLLGYGPGLLLIISDIQLLLFTFIRMSQM